MTRRTALRGGLGIALGIAGVSRLVPGGASTAAAAGPFSLPLPRIPEITDAEFTMTASVADVQVFPSGPPTRMFTFNGSFPGPLIRRPAGEPTRMTVLNRLPAELGSITVHHHGSHVQSNYDGLPERYVIDPGAQYTYVYPGREFGEDERATLEWYHDHSHSRTARNVWHGLAGMWILEDEYERALGLPSGEYELPLLICDRGFDENNQLRNDFLEPNREQVPALETWGAGRPPFDEITGDTYLVNGAPQPHVEVAAARYRLRVLNASIFRPFDLQLSNGAEITQIGSEGGLLPEAVSRPSVLMGPAERTDLIVDLRANKPGDKVVLRSAPRTDLGQLPGSQSPDADLLELRVVREAEDTSVVPANPRPLPSWASQLSTIPDRVWSFGIGADEAGRSAWTINGRAFLHGRIDAKPELDSVETWALVNTSSGAHSHWVHLHDVDWCVVSRNGRPPSTDEAGLKEVFRIDPGEVLLIGTRFTDFVGVYMLHCHLLNHEDNGMMTGWEVVPPGQGDLARRQRGASARSLSAGRTVDFPIGDVQGSERACVADVLEQVRRRPGRPAKVRMSPGMALGTPRRNDSVNQFICDIKEGIR